MNLTEKINRFYNKLTKSDKSWENREYDFHLVFGQKDENKSPWLKSNWNSDFKPYFDAIIQQLETSEETGIYVNKFKAEKRIAKKDNTEFVYHSEIKLGRLKWDDKSHDKWTIESLEEEHFESFELWSPSKAICEKREFPPEIFISISNERNSDNSRNLQFGYFMVVAVAKNLNINTKSILTELSKKVNSKAAVLKNRKWGTPEKEGNWAFKNGIQDTFSTGIYQEKDLHTLEFNEIEFEPVWKIIYKEN